MSILKWQVNSSSDFAIFFVVMTHNSSVNFKLVHFLLWAKRSHQSPNFHIFKCSGKKFPNFSCYFSNHRSLFLSFFIILTHNSSVNFKLILFLLWAKGSHQSPNFETFECSGKNLPNFSYHFPNHLSVFLQIFHHSLVPWKIIPSYFFRSIIICFVHKEAIKTNFLDFWVLLSKFVKFLMSI